MPKKKTKRTSSSKTKSGSSTENAVEQNGPIPQGFGTVTPYLVVKGAAQAIEFYKSAFGALGAGTCRGCEDSYAAGQPVLG